MAHLPRLAALVLVVALAGCKSDHASPTATPAATPPPTTAKVAAKPTPPPTPPPRAPSTGKEMPVAAAPVLSVAEAGALIDQAMTEMKQATPACAKVVDALNSALPVAAPMITDKSEPVYLALQRCAGVAKRWRTLRLVSNMLIHAIGAKGHPEELIRAQTELGDYDLAMKNITDLGKAFPTARGELLAARTLLVCKREDWKLCLAASGDGLKYVAKSDKKLESEAALKNKIFLALAEVMLGQAKPAAKLIAEFDALAEKKHKPALPFFELLKQKLAEEAMHHALVDTVIQPEIPLGVYHLMGTPLAGAPIEVRLYNYAKQARSIRVEAEIVGVSEHTAKTVTLLGGKLREVVLLVPPIKAGFDQSGLRSAQPAEVSVKVTEQGGKGEVVLAEDTYKVQVLPRDSLPLHRRIGGDAEKDTPEFIGAWVTPNAKAVEALLTAAKARQQSALASHTFAGEQMDTLSQVQAIYDELHARGVSYVMDPQINSDAVEVQRTRLPTEVLGSTNAQCLEGTILFASAFEAIGLRPIIVLIPHHAFIGWHATKQDGIKPGTPMFVETTMVGNAPFKAAVAHAEAKIKEEAANGDFKSGAAQLIELTDLRAHGISPQPTE